MDKPCLNNKDEYPDDEVLSRHLGSVKRVWDSFMNDLKETHPALAGEWRYYKDGSNWLYKLTKGKKTVCWVSVWPRLFKTTFYFPDRAEEFITASTLDKEYVDQFLHGKRYGKIRGITVAVQKATNLKATKILIDIKKQVK